MTKREGAGKAFSIPRYTEGVVMPEKGLPSRRRGRASKALKEEMDSRLRENDHSLRVVIADRRGYRRRLAEGSLRVGAIYELSHRLRDGRDARAPVLAFVNP